MRSQRGNPFVHLRIWIVLILFAGIFVATGTAEIVAPGDILPVTVTGVPSNVVEVNIPFLDAIIWNFFIEPIINTIPILSPTAVHFVDPNDIIKGTVPFPFR